MADQSLPRLVNERRILTQLRQNATMSRAELARRLGLTPATITNLVDNLRHEGLIVEVAAKGTQTRGLGRPAVALTLNRDGGWFLGVEVGIEIIRFAVVDLALAVVDCAAIATPPDISPVAAVDLIAAHLRKLDRGRFKRHRMRGVCITVPGLVRTDGHVVHLPILGWRDVNVLDLATQRLKTPVLVENNANAAAFGEVYTQPGLDTDCIVYLKLGMGCGGAAIVNGRLLRGSGGTAAEFGHLAIVPDGAPCSCGQRGCLEAYVNLPALGRAFDASTAWTPEELRALPDHIAALASRQEAGARRATAFVIGHLATGITSLVNAFNPGTVLLGGAMRPVLEGELARLRQAVEGGIVPGMRVPEIRLSRLGPYECAIGVAAIAHHHAFDVSTIDIGSTHPRAASSKRAQGLAG